MNYNIIFILSAYYNNFRLFDLFGEIVCSRV